MLGYVYWHDATHTGYEMGFNVATLGGTIFGMLLFGFLVSSRCSIHSKYADRSLGRPLWAAETLWNHSPRLDRGNLRRSDKFCWLHPDTP
jgi:hypothetical protein